MPTFGSQTIPDQTFTCGKPIRPVTLPEATGGDLPLIYGAVEFAFVALTGISFDEDTRILSGTPSCPRDRTTPIIYFAEDADVDVAILRFNIILQDDTTPTFGAATIPDQAYAADTDIGTVTLPTATGGNRALTYTLTPALPDGLTFDGTATPPTITGTPTVVTPQTHTYTVTDDDGSTAALTFTLIDGTPNIIIADGLRMTAGEGEVVTLDASGSSDHQDQPITMFQWTVDPNNEETVTLSDDTAAAPTFTAPEVRTTLNFDLTVTDGSGRTATAMLTVQVGRNSSERVVEKTLAAFGRAFATGTVGVFEDYLTNAGANANTSHFTLGGHKFELATTTPAQTLDSRVASVRKPLTRQRTLTLENDDSVVNTLSVSYPQKYKSPSVSFPNDRKTGSDSDHVFHRIGNPYVTKLEPVELERAVFTPRWLAQLTIPGDVRGSADKDRGNPWRLTPYRCSVPAGVPKARMTTWASIARTGMNALWNFPPDLGNCISIHNRRKTMTYPQPQPTETPVYVGMDVSKSELVVAMRRAGQTDKPRIYPNTSAGIARLCRRIKTLGAATEVKVCMEATGQYGMAAALALYTRGYCVSVENPARIKAFMHSTMRRNKTDSADAAAIAEYAERMPTRPWKPRPAARERLHQALSTRALHIKASTDLARQLKSGAVDAVSQHLHTTIAALNDRITAIEGDLRATVANCRELQTTVTLLRTIPGFGKVAAWTLAAEVDVRDFDNAKQLAAYVGVTPQRRQSGSGCGSTRLSKQGNSRLRRVLYMGAISAMKNNPHIRVCAERWRSPRDKGNGRPLSGRQAACAAMHKLTRIAFGVLKSGKPYEPKSA